MNVKEAWEILEIEPTEDKRAIKKAYARAAKKCHPEENPEEFQRVYDAYKQLMDYVENPGNGQIFDVSEFMRLLEQQNQRKNEAQKKDPKQEGQDSGAQGEEEDRMEQMFQDIEKERKKERLSVGSEEEEYLRAPEIETGEEEGQAQVGEEERIQQMFRDMKSAQKKKLSIFRHKWQWFLRNQTSGSAEKEMRAYIQTPWFTEIMDEPAVLSQLSMGIDRYCRYNGGALKEDIWHLYAMDKFGPEDGQMRYQTLFHVLEADLMRFHMRMEREIQMRQKLSRQVTDRSREVRRMEKTLLPGILVAVALCVLVSVLVVAIVIPAVSEGTGSGKRSEKWEKKQILSFLEETYPMAEFLEVEPSDGGEKEKTKKEYGIESNYIVKVAGSDMEVHANVTYKDGDIYIGEDFGKQSLWRLAQNRDLMCELCYIEEPWNDGNSHYLMVGYYQISSELEKLEGELRDFMERFREFAQSEEVREFVNIEGISFAVINCYQPTAFIRDAGGMPEPLLYGFGELPEAEVMAEDMADCITEYYIHMEPWQLEDDPKYPEWLEWYEECVEALPATAMTEEAVDLLEMAQELGVQVVLYGYSVFDYLSLGDMYRLAQKADIPIRVMEDGSGFIVEKDGSETVYSYENISGLSCGKAIEMLTEE